MSSIPSRNDATTPDSNSATPSAADRASEADTTLGEELYDYLNALFVIDPLIDEIGLLASCEIRDHTVSNSTAHNTSVLSTENCVRATHLPMPCDAEQGCAFYLSRQHKLALAYWALPALHSHAKMRMQQYRRQVITASDATELRVLNLSHHSVVLKKEQQQISAVHQVSNNNDQQQIDVNCASRALLLISGDDYTAWNCRRLLVHQRIHQTVKSVLLDSNSNTTMEADLQHLSNALHSVFSTELRLNQLVITKHVKSGETWAYRQWLLRLEIDTMQQLRSSTRDRTMHQSVDGIDWHAEIAMTQVCAEHYARNYYAWTHRRFALLQQSQQLFDTSQNESQHAQFWLATCRDLTSWCSSHISDASAFDTRWFALNQYCCCFAHAHASGIATTTDSVHHDPISSVLSGELEWIRELHSRYEGHETLWLYRRYVVSRLLKQYTSHCNKSNSGSHQHSNHVNAVVSHNRKSTLLLRDECQFALNQQRQDDAASSLDSLDKSSQNSLDTMHRAMEQHLARHYLAHWRRRRELQGRRKQEIPIVIS